MTSPELAELERALGDARQRLAALRADGARGSENAGAPGGPARGRGVAGGGLIRVLAASGHLERAELDPRVLRLAPGRLAAELASAANAALDDLRARSPAQDPDPAADLSALARQLGAVKDQALRQMQEIVSAIQDGVRQFGAQAQVSGDIGMPDVAGLFEETERMLQPLLAAQRGSADHADARTARGAGQAGPGGLVRAVTVPPGRVGSLTVHPRAIRAGSHAVAGYVVAAVNMSLDDLDRRRRDRGATAPDRAEMSQQAHELQDAALRQMQMFGSSLSDLLRSMRPDSSRK
jgi:hypothetical protein